MQFLYFQITISGAAEPVQIRSDKSGKFSARLPNGDYKIVAEHDDKSVKIAKQEMQVTVAHQSVQLDAFLVQSFAVKGKVLTHATKGKAFAKAKVSITHDGKTVDVITSEDGSFQIDNVRNAPLSAKVSAEGFDFDAVTLNSVEPGVNFPTILPARYLLTGKVERDSLPADTEVRTLIILKLVM